MSFGEWCFGFVVIGAVAGILWVVAHLPRAPANAIQTIRNGSVECSRVYESRWTCYPIKRQDNQPG